MCVGKPLKQIHINQVQELGEETHELFTTCRSSPSGVGFCWHKPFRGAIW